MVGKSIIAIPSYGRTGNTSRFCTRLHIGPKSWKRTIYYVEPEEKSAYKKYLKGTGARIRTTERADVPKKWGSIMDLIIDECSQECDHLVIMDDDLKLAVRPHLPKNATLFKPMTGNGFDVMIGRLRQVTSQRIPLTSAQYRQFSQGKIDTFCLNQRISMIWSLSSKFFRQNTQFRFYKDSRLDFMSDYYFFLNLLVHGHKNLCINEYTKDDKPNAVGGEQLKRTTKTFNKAVKEFASMFPNFVSVKEKQGKGNWRDGMLGVTIRAKRAYKSYINTHKKTPAHAGAH